MTHSMWLYECGICDSLHPWDFFGDCRDDTNRYADLEDYAERNNITNSMNIEIFSWEDRRQADKEK